MFGRRVLKVFFEQFYLHPIHFSLHPIREMGIKTWVCVIWGVERKKLGINRISRFFFNVIVGPGHARNGSGLEPRSFWSPVVVR